MGKSIIKYCTDGLARQAMPRKNAESRTELIFSLSMVRNKKYSDAVNKNVKTVSLCIRNAEPSEFGLKSCSISVGNPSAGII